MAEGLEFKIYEKEQDLYNMQRTITLTYYLRVKMP